MFALLTATAAWRQQNTTTKISTAAGAKRTGSCTPCRRRVRSTADDNPADPPPGSGSAAGWPASRSCQARRSPCEQGPAVDLFRFRAEQLHQGRSVSRQEPGAGSSRHDTPPHNSHRVLLQSVQHMHLMASAKEHLSFSPRTSLKVSRLASCHTRSPTFVHWNQQTGVRLPLLSTCGNHSTCFCCQCRICCRCYTSAITFWDPSPDLHADPDSEVCFQDCRRTLTS